MIFAVLDISPPLTKISTGATRLMFIIYNKFYILSIVLHKKFKKK